MPYSGLPLSGVAARNGSGRAREWRCAAHYWVLYLIQRVGERLATGCRHAAEPSSHSYIALLRCDIQMTVDPRPTTPVSALRQGVSRRRSARVAASDQSMARPTMRRFNLYHVHVLHSTSRRPILKLPQPCVQPSRRTWLGCACPMSLPYTVVSHNQPIWVLAAPQGPVS